MSDKQRTEAEKFLLRLDTGWSIHPSSNCTGQEIAYARLQCRWFQIGSLGYVLRRPRPPQRAS